MEKHTKKRSWRRAAAVMAGRLVGMVYAAGAGVLLWRLQDLAGPQWVLTTFTYAGAAVMLASLYMLVASWIGRGSVWGALAGVMLGFFGTLPMIALATARIILPLVELGTQPDRARVGYLLPLPVWGMWVAAGLSGLLAVGALLSALPKRTAPGGFGPILPEA